MGTETKPITEMKCRDCQHCVFSGWFEPSRVCEITGFPIDGNAPACISVLPKLKRK